MRRVVLKTHSFVMLIAVSLLMATGADASVAKKKDRMNAQVESDLDFGKLAVLGAGGAVTMDPSGVRHFTGQVENLGGTWTPASFTLEGEPLAEFAIIHRRTVPLKGENGGTILLRDVRCSPSDFGRFDAAGRASVTCGASIRLKSNVRAGRYVRSVRLSLDYITFGKSK